MQRRLLTVGVCAALLAGAAACSDFLSGPGLTENPNRPSVANADQLFVGVQVATFAEFTGAYPLQLLPMYVRQFAGVNRQWQTYANFSNGGPSENDADGAFTNTYASGGLVDIRAIQAQARAAGNDKFLGIAEVYEALRIGMAASLFTAIPYSGALEPGTSPPLDPPAEVLAQVQKVLDSAIVHLGSGRGAGPAAVDFVYGNDAAAWRRAAHTLKARFYAHTANAAGASASDVFTRVQSEAAQGIRTHAGDWVVRFTTSAGEQNLYYNFLNSRSGDIEPDEYFVGLLRTRGETARLDSLYTATTGGACSGGFVGSTQGNPNQCSAQFDIGPTTPMKLLTAAENEMLLAEAQYRLGNPSAALTTLNAYRAQVGGAAVAPTGAGILVAILTEKYARNYLNPEVYFDYLRTCVPNFDISYAVSSHRYVPARFPYGYTERITNSNVPEMGGPLNNDYANPLFPKRATDPLGAACSGQVNRPG